MTSVILGTAQWGLKYGVTNSADIPSDEDISRLLSQAASVGVSVLDTAPAYGNAESRIGVLAPGFKVQSKVTLAGATPEDIEASVRLSLGTTGSVRLDGVLVHDWHDANEDERASGLAVLGDLKRSGPLGRLGVSVYGPDDLAQALTYADEIDVIQVPVNVFDQRLEGSALVTRMLNAGIAVQARSVLLQGLLVEPDVAGPLGRTRALQRWKASLPNGPDMRMRAAIGYVKTRDWVDEVVVAVATVGQFRDLWDAWLSPVTDVEWARFACDDLDVLDPRRWPPRGGVPA